MLLGLQKEFIVKFQYFTLHLSTVLSGFFDPRRKPPAANPSDPRRFIQMGYVDGARGWHLGLLGFILFAMSSTKKKTPS